MCCSGLALGTESALPSFGFSPFIHQMCPWAATLTTRCPEDSLLAAPRRRVSDEISLKPRGRRLSTDKRVRRSSFIHAQVQKREEQRALLQPLCTIPEISVMVRALKSSIF